MDLQRMRKLAGLLTEGVIDVPRLRNDLGEESSEVDEKAPPGMEDMVMDLKKEYPGEPEKAFATAWSIYNKKHGSTDKGMMDEESSEFNQPDDDHFPDMQADISAPEDDATYQEALALLTSLDNGMNDLTQALDIVSRSLQDQGFEKDEIASMIGRLSDEITDAGDEEELSLDQGPNDYTDDAAALASAGHGSDEDYGDFDGEFEEAVDFNNGYDTEEYAAGNDFFPNGADSPVVKAVGPSGARHGDNPEQKKMQVEAVHKELVYGYRNYLNESAKTQKKS